VIIPRQATVSTVAVDSAKLDEPAGDQLLISIMLSDERIAARLDAPADPIQGDL
jgi:hypothetical protein